MRRGLSRQGVVTDPRSSSPLVRSYVSLLEQVSLATRADHRAAVSADGDPVPPADARVTRSTAVVVTSPARGDGRTTIAANLAVCAAALGGCRVLLVDADLEQAGLSRLFAAGGKPGLAELLTGETEWSESVRTIGEGSLSLLPAGRGISAAIVAHADRADALMSQWRARYDWIIVDTAPILLSAAAAVLARPSDGAVLVLRAGRTRPEVLEAALDRLGEGGGKVLGSVLNRRRYMIPNGTYRRL